MPAYFNRLRAELAAASLSAAVLAAAGCRSQADSAGSKPTAESEAKRARVTALFTRMSTLRDNTAVPPREERACSEQVLDEGLRGRESKLLLVDFEFLERLAKPEAERSGQDQERWKFLTAGTLRAIPSNVHQLAEPALTDAAFKAVKLGEAHSFVVVIRSEKRQAPRVEGDRFHAGVLEGWLILADLSGGPPLCATRVAARSSEEVAGRGGQNQNDVIWRDFTRQVRTALDDAAARLSARFEIDMD